MSEIGKLALIRKTMPATETCVYLNTGSVGPLANITYEILNQANESEYEQGRIAEGMWEVKAQAKANLRQSFAHLVKAPIEAIALSHHTTDGMNIAAHGLTWQPGDEVITTTLEHPGGLIPLYVLQKRWGVQVKLVELEASDSPETIVARFAAEITPRTRLLAFSHVAWNLGIQLPLAALTTLAHQHQAWVAVDGAQSTGAIPLDLPASQVDFYAMPGQKWLCGPEGTGALYVRPELLEQLEQTFVGYASLDNGQYDLAGNFVPGADARRFEVGTLYTPGLRAMAANLHWLADSVGWDWIHARIVHLADYARTALSGIAGVDVITPVGTQSGLTSFTLTEQQPEQVVATLAERGIMLRTIQRPHALRLSTGFFNLEAEIDYLVETLQSILTD